MHRCCETACSVPVRYVLRPQFAVAPHVLVERHIPLRSPRAASTSRVDQFHPCFCSYVLIFCAYDLQPQNSVSVCATDKMAELDEGRQITDTDNNQHLLSASTERLTFLLSSSSPQFAMTIGTKGLSFSSTGTCATFSTTFCPLITFPKTTCLP